MPGPSRKYYVIMDDEQNIVRRLIWANTPEMIAALPPEARWITRAEAFRLCREDRRRRQYTRGISGYPDTMIYPAVACHDSTDWYDFMDHCDLIDGRIIPALDREGKSPADYFRMPRGFLRIYGQRR